jgi:hypothetical protein
MPFEITACACGIALVDCEYHSPRGCTPAGMASAMRTPRDEMDAYMMQIFPQVRAPVGTPRFVPPPQVARKPSSAWVEGPPGFWVAYFTGGPTMPSHSYYGTAHNDAGKFYQEDCAMAAGYIVPP